MICYICSEDNWHIRKDLNPISEIGICKKCGNVSHIINEKEKENIRKFYKYEYRKNVNVDNIITTTRKLNYIKVFILDFVKKQKDTSNDLKMCDIGAATGYLCHWFQNQGYKVSGTELPIIYRRFSEYYYGIPLTEEIEKKHQYDFISMYHSLEHISQPDLELKKIIEVLKPEGLLLISVPEWFYEFENLAGIGQFNIQNYFHQNHICCFSRQSMKNLLAKNKLEIIKEDYLVYGQTYLVKKTDKKLKLEYEDWQKVNENINKLIKALELFYKNKFKEATDIWFNFPDAHLRFIFDIHKKDMDRQEYIWNEILPKLNSLRIKSGYAIWLYQLQRLEEALKYLNEVIKIKPNEDLMVYVGWILFQLGRYQDAMRAFHNVIQINPLKWRECLNWICKCATNMMTWDERAEIEIKEKLFKKANPKIELQK